MEESTIEARLEELIPRLDAVIPRLDDLIAELRTKRGPSAQGWYTVAEAAEYMGIGKSTLRALAANRQITFSRLQRKLLFKREWLDRFLESSVRVGACERFSRVLNRRP